MCFSGGKMMVQQNSGQGSPSPLHELRQRLGLPPVVVAPAPEMISDDKELLALGQALSENTGSSPGTTTSILEVCCCSILWRYYAMDS
jgi:hypothetical protein